MVLIFICWVTHQHEFNSRKTLETLKSKSVSEDFIYSFHDSSREETLMLFSFLAIRSDLIRDSVHWVECGGQTDGVICWKLHASWYNLLKLDICHLTLLYTREPFWFTINIARCILIIISNLIWLYHHHNGSLPITPFTVFEPVLLRLSLSPLHQMCD